MKTTEGVEWGVHACAVLAALPPGSALNAAALADFHKLPSAYMAKHLQSLVRAGLLTGTRGANGGYRLARPARDISLWDIQAAIEGTGPRFRCQDIRRQGPCAGYANPDAACVIACAFAKAEAAYRTHLKGVSIAQVAKQVAADYGQAGRNAFIEWVQTKGASPAPLAREDS